jgi:hypothetical protein
VLLALKVLLVPALIAIVTLGARRWGPRVGGWLSGLPTVAGPTLCFYAWEQGPAFAARASHATLVGLVAVPLFCVAYVYSARRVSWPFSLFAGWSAFLLGAAAFARVEPGLTAGWALLAASCALAYRAMPVPALLARPPVHSRWDLPLRMIAAGTLVALLTTVADRLGPSLSGLLTPFPVAIAVIAAFTHTQAGSDPVAVFFRGFLPALASFGLFCVVLALALEPLGLLPALAIALALQLSTQTMTLWATRRAVEPARVGELIGS